MGLGPARGFERAFEGATDAGQPAFTVRIPAFASPAAQQADPVRRLGRGAAMVVMLVAFAAGLSGCQSIDMSASSVAQLRVIDASPDAPAIDSYQNNSALAYNLAFGTVTSYVPMSPGSYTLAADKAGTRQALVVSTATLLAGHQYTGIVGNVDAAMQQMLLVDQSTPAPAGEVTIRLIDQATRVGAVDVYLVPKGGKLTTTAPSATNFSFGSTFGYFNLPAGPYEIVVLPAGTVPVSTLVTLLSGAQIDYASGAVRTVVLIDAPPAPASSLDPAPLIAGSHGTAGVQAIIADDCDPPGA